MADNNPASPLRLPVAVLLGLAAPPVGLLAWIALSGSGRRDYLRSNWVRAGFIVGMAGTLPLLVVVVAARLGLWPDPNPNPIGLGLLLLLAGGAGTILIGIGIAVVSAQDRPSPDQPVAPAESP